jgi:3-deoxy-7-phosphoheptulonate synthase
VLPLSLAAVGAGADGLIVEVHPEPERARCDGDQALKAHEFDRYLRRVRAVARVIGRRAPDPTALAAVAV